MSTVFPALTNPALQEALKALTPETRACILHLIDYFASTEPVDLYPESKLGAVLVLLYEEDDALRVLLTTRSMHLRTHAGETALPGGRKDPVDIDITATAFREANEEVGLPINNPSIHTLGRLEPFVSLHSLIVVPTVALLAKPEVLTGLRASESEVSRIFSHPLAGILDPTVVTRVNLAPKGSEEWPYETELYNTSDSVVPKLGNTSYRMHRFRTSASSITGLTADILIRTAEIAYKKTTTYDRFAPDQLRTSAEIIQAVSEYERENQQCNKH